MAGRARLIAATLLLIPGLIQAQGSTRRLTTIDAIRQFPGYYHLQNVVLRGELTEDSRRPMLRADDLEIRAVLDDVSSESGPVEIRGLVMDVGRLEPGDPRLGPYTELRGADNWPRPGEEFVVKVTTVSEAAPATTPSVRAIALEPWKFDGQTVTVVGNFRGRNLFGDSPAAPGSGRYDFVLRGAEGAVWVTGIRPRGRGFDLDVERRFDSNTWVEVTGVVSRTRGLVSIAATKIALAEAPDTRVTEAAPPPPPPPPVEVVFSSPTEAEADVAVSAPIRIQFSRGLQESTIRNNIRVTYQGEAPVVLVPAFTYDAATRSLQLEFAPPLEPLRTVKVELLDGLRAFDGGVFTPWQLTFSLGAR